MAVIEQSLGHYE